VPDPEPPSRPLRYLALGDSFTIGTGLADESQNFPSRLAHRLRECGVDVELTNPAVNGYTTLDLIRHELPQLEQVHPDLVSILVGANDIVQGRPLDDYRKSLREIYDAVAALRLAPACVLSVSIPDWSAAPAAKEFGVAADLRRQIDAFNGVAREESAARGFTFVDVAELSRSRAGEPGWLADDALHPAAAQYAAWAEQLWPAVAHAWSQARA
jgi:lysophospholipase L1-like esterase